MKIIQNFSSKKHIKEFPITDILVWYIGLLKLRALGNTIKLYCEKKDFEFLKYWGLFDLYDEIDDSFLSSNELVNSEIINGTNFWSKRKIECIKNEFDVANEPFVYMDTDIILNVPFKIDSEIDLIAWSPETQEKIYIPWNHLSIPNGYKMPKYIYQTEGAYNCGILYFRTKQQFLEYRRQYLNYTMNNPCETRGVTAWEETIRNIWACNAEQRILKAVAEHNNWNVQLIMDKQAPGACEFGIHYYYMRGFWRLLPLEDFLKSEEKAYWTEVLNFQLDQLLTILLGADREAFNKFMTIDWIKDFYENKNLIMEYK